MSGLRDRIVRLIQTSGPISVAQYMTLALHDPKEGYYATRDPFGAGGDFITAPEISQMFGEMLGWAIAVAWLDWGSPLNPTLVELGPGRGTLMSDMLRTMKALPRLWSQLRVAMIENSPTLRAVQQQTLAGTGVPIRWADSFAEAEIEGPLYVVANEFFDALPIRQWVHTGEGIFRERLVGLDPDGAFRFEASPWPLPFLPPGGEQTAVGTIYETTDASELVMEDIGRAIQEQRGAAFAFDYGYDKKGFGETLQAVRQHTYADVLNNPGENDLTAHVDFPALVEAAKRGGAEPLELMEQGEVLKMWGIEARAEQLGGGAMMERQIHRLIAPDQMGKLFKVLCVIPKNASVPAGFAHR